MLSFSRLSLILLVSGLPSFAANAPRIKNFDRVDEHVFRGAQPTSEGFRDLAKLGVKSILDLREADQRSAEERRVVTAAGMRYVNVPMTGLTPPTEAEIAKIMALLQDPSAGPVFVHCKRGADRTGAVIAAYHITYHGWDNQRALKDAKSHGMAFFQFPRQDFIRQFQLRTVDASARPSAPVVAPDAASVIR